MLTSFADLPQEILDQVIDFLHDDKKALAGCSLVAHAWLHPARSHLFHRLRLQPQSFARAAQLLAQKPCIAGYVRELKIEEPSLLVNVIAASTLLEMLQYFPNLHTMHLDKIALTAPTGILRWRHSHLGKLRLTLKSCDPLELFNTLALFSAVYVAELRIDDPPSLGPAPPVLSLKWEVFSGWRVGVLVMPERFPDIVQELVRKTCTVGIVQTVVVLDYHGRNGAQLATFLAQVGQYIPSLIWVVDDPDGRSYWSRTVPRKSSLTCIPSSC